MWKTTRIVKIMRSAKIDKVIIDGCNVAECEWMIDGKDVIGCNSYICCCEEINNCYFKQLQRAKAEMQEKVLKMAEAEIEIEKLQAENEKLKERLENKEKAYIELCNANNRKKEQIKNLNYMLFEEKEMTTQEWKLKYRLANKERKFIQYKEITIKKLNNYKQTLEEIREIAKLHQYFNPEILEIKGNIGQIQDLKMTEIYKKCNEILN